MRQRLSMTSGARLATAALLLLVLIMGAANLVATHEAVQHARDQLCAAFATVVKPPQPNVPPVLHARQVQTWHNWLVFSHRLGCPRTTAAAAPRPRHTAPSPRPSTVSGRPRGTGASGHPGSGVIAAPAPAPGSPVIVPGPAPSPVPPVTVTTTATVPGPTSPPPSTPPPTPCIVRVLSIRLCLGST